MDIKELRKYGEVIRIDEHGNDVFKCHWTGKEVGAPDAVITGGFYPGIKSKFIACKDHTAAKKQSHHLFNQMDANCNTCKHLDRIKHSKDSAGFLYGACKIDSQDQKHYQVRNGVMMFHPDDHMGMECYESRE